MVGERIAGVTFKIFGADKAAADIGKVNTAMDEFGQKSQQVSQQVTTGFQNMAQSVVTVPAGMVTQLTGLTNRAQALMETARAMKIPAPELDVAGWNRVAERMSSTYTISGASAKQWREDFIRISGDVKAKQDEIAKAAEDSARRQAEAAERAKTGYIALGVVLSAVSAKALQFVGTMALTAGRIEELEILLEVTRSNAVELAEAEGDLTKASSLNAAAVQEQVEGIRDLHLSGIVANKTVAQLIRYNLDWSKATELARLSQDAATFAAQDSSKALDGLIRGITTLQPRILRTYGIMVNLTEAYRTFAAQNNLVATELTLAQRQQAAFNQVLSLAPTIAGAYEASLESATKQLRSIKTDTINLFEAYGEFLEPAVASVARTFREFLQTLTALPAPTRAFATAMATGGTATATLVTTTGTAILTLGKLRGVFAVLAGTGVPALLGIGAAATALAGVLAYLDAQKDALIDLHAEILTTSTSYDDYIRKLDAAGLSTRALTEDTYNLIAAQEEEQRIAMAQEIAEFQKQINDELSLTHVLWAGLTNLIEQAGEGGVAILKSIEETLSMVNINLTLTDNLVAGLFEETGLLAGSTDELNRMLMQMSTEESWRTALGDPNFVANLREQYEDADPRVRRLVDALILFGSALETEGLPSSVLMQDALLGLGFTVDEVTELMRTFDIVLTQVTQSAEDFADAAGLSQEFLSAVDEATEKSTEKLLDAIRKREEKLDDLNQKYRDKKADAWKDYNDKLIDISEDTYKALAELDEEYAQDKIDAWDELQQDLADAEREFRQEIEDINREHARDLADADRDYAQERKDARKDLNRDLEDLARDLAKKIEDIESDLAKEIEDIRADHLQDLLDLEKDYAAQREDLLADFAQRAEDIEAAYRTEPTEPTTDELRKALLEELALIRESTSSYVDSISQREKEILEELEKLKQEELAALEEEKEKELALLDEQHDEEKAARDAALEEELAAAQAAYQEELAAAQAAYEERKAERQRQYSEELADLAEQHKREKAEIDRRHQERLSDLQAQHAREKAEIDRRYQEKLSDIDEQYNLEKELIKQKLAEQNAAAREKYDDALQDMIDAKERERESIHDEHDKTKQQILEDYEDTVMEAAEKFGELPEAFQPTYDALEQQARNEIDRWKNTILDGVQALHDDLEARSPSRVMMRLGESMVEGLALGLGSTSASDLIDDAFNAQAMQANISAVLPAERTSLPMGMGNRTYQRTDQNTLNVTAQYQQYQSEASLRDDLSLWNGMMRAWGR